MHELPSVAKLLDWVREGHRRLEDELQHQPPDALAQPSILPGWTRGHIVTHLARNADGLRNLLYWARTGERTPMYPSYEARNSAIEMGAGRGLTEQLEDLKGASARFVEAAEQLDDSQWNATVETVQGQAMPARQVPWTRAREVWVHLGDLDLGLRESPLPDAVARALLEDVARWRDRTTSERVTMRAPGLPELSFGGSRDQQAVEISGSAPDLVAWLTGRSPGTGLAVAPPHALPVLSRWL
jgi:maleylpyruvate isomerase